MDKPAMKNQQSKRFLTHLAGWSGLAFLAVGLINLVLDPYWQFPFTPGNTIQGINHQISPQALSNTYPSLLIKRQQAQLAHQAATTAIIGSSRTLYGLNTCDDPTIQKAGLFGISRYQALSLLDAVIENASYQQVFIEVESMVNDATFQPATTSRLKALFSTHHLVTGIRNLNASLEHKEHTVPLCRVTNHNPVAYNGQQPDPALKQLYARLEQSFRQQGIQTVINTLRNTCAQASHRTDNPLNITLFLGPVHPDLIPYSTLKNVMNHIEHAVKNADIPSTCRINTAQFSQQLSLTDPNNWFDVNHYKPVLGEPFFHAITLRESGRESVRK